VNDRGRRAVGFRTSSVPCCPLPGATIARRPGAPNRPCKLLGRQPAHADRGHRPAHCPGRRRLIWAGAREIRPALAAGRHHRRHPGRATITTTPRLTLPPTPGAQPTTFPPSRSKLDDFPPRPRSGQARTWMAAAGKTSAIGATSSKTVSRQTRRIRITYLSAIESLVAPPSKEGGTCIRPATRSGCAVTPSQLAESTGPQPGCKRKRLRVSAAKLHDIGKSWHFRRRSSTSPTS